MNTVWEVVSWSVDTFEKGLSLKVMLLGTDRLDSLLITNGRYIAIYRDKTLEYLRENMMPT